MKNLKRTLSFALATVMLIGMMVVGVSAADFGDADKIEHTDAVNTLVALNVINGKDDGNYDPEGIVTRAEMAKLITVALNGGKDPVLGTKAEPTYTDIKGHWAEAYIEYCASLEIISGRGDGTFDPNGTVTGNEAAKMMLVAMGWDSTIFNFTGANWAINVGVEANKVKLFDELETIDPAEGLTRDNTAQLVYNGILADTMEKSPNMSVTNGNITWDYKLVEKSIFSEKFGGKVFIGTFTGNTDTLTLPNDGYIQVKGNLDTDEDTVAVKTANFPAELDIANIGEEVKILFKEGKSGTSNQPDKNDTIYGVFNTGKTEVYNVTKGDIQEGKKTADGKIKFGGTTYELVAGAGTTADPTAPFVINYNYGAKSVEYTTAAAAAAVIENNTTGLRIQSGDTIKFVANEDGKLYAAYVVEYNLAKVTSVSSSKVTLSGVGSIDLEDNDVAEGLAVDDVVVYTRFYNGSDKDEAFFTVAKAETVEGDITGYTGTEKVVIDGTTYKITGKKLPSSLTDDSMSSLSGEIDTTVVAYLVAGMVGAIDRNDEETSDYALVVGTNSQVTSDSAMTEGKLKLLLTDGTKETYVVDEDSTKQANVITAGNLVKYSVTSDGTLKVKSIVTDKFSSTSTTPVWDESTKLVGSAGVAASNAVIYVNVGTSSNPDYKVYNIRDLDDINDTGKDVYYVTNSAGRVTTAFVDLQRTPGGAASDTMYGMVVASKGVVKIDDDEYNQYTVWTGENITVNVDPDGSVGKLSTGNYVSFKKTNDDLYTDSNGNLKVLGSTDATDGAVKEYSTSDATLSYYTVTKKVDNVYEGTGLKTAAMDDDAVIIYVNRDDKKAGDEIGVGAFDTSTGYANVKIVFDTDGKTIVALFVETSGECDINGKTTALTGTVVEDGKTVIYGGEATVAAGDTDVVVRDGTVTMTGGEADVYGGKVTMSGGSVKAKGGEFTVTGSTAKIKLSKENGTGIKITIGEKTLTLANNSSEVVKVVEDGAFISALSGADTGETWTYHTGEISGTWTKNA